MSSDGPGSSYLFVPTTSVPLNLRMLQPLVGSHQNLTGSARTVEVIGATMMVGRRWQKSMTTIFPRPSKNEPRVRGHLGT
jgi:hypothetical protein